jgi:hypothetical protein
MRTKSALLLLAAAALAGTGTPAQAAGARPCDPGYVGVVVYDGSGDLVEACVRTSDLTPIVNDLRDYAGELADWATGLRPRCYQYPDGTIACERLDPPPRPIR